MQATTTVVFADLTGSTGLFEALGNAEATRVVKGLTDWIGEVCTSHGGRVVKSLGDGVLALFPNGRTATEAMVELQRSHRSRKRERGPARQLELQIGMACGEIVEVEGDCYGDAVNVASRLSDLSGAEQIWATDTVIDQMPAPPSGVRFRGLGAVPIRGKSEARLIYRVEWQAEMASDMMTLPASLQVKTVAPTRAKAAIDMTYLDQHAVFEHSQMPVHMGRAGEAQFVVSDPRVSRLHARIDWRNGSFVLTDLSSYGTWVRFDGAPTELAMRRDDCVLHGSGEIALGADFNDFTVPVIRFVLTVG